MTGLLCDLHFQSVGTFRPVTSTDSVLCNSASSNSLCRGLLRGQRHPHICPLPHLSTCLVVQTCPFNTRGFVPRDGPSLARSPRAAAATCSVAAGRCSRRRTSPSPWCPGPHSASATPAPSRDPLPEEKRGFYVHGTVLQLGRRRVSGGKKEQKG